MAKKIEKAEPKYGKREGYVCPQCDQIDDIHEDAHGLWCMNCGPHGPRPISQGYQFLTKMGN